MMKRSGGWLFVSYANEDIAKVRGIRNLLEEKGFKPIMFYLKCMEEGNHDKELWSLISREIKARRWFLLADSPNAQESKWVQDEVDYVRSLPDKEFLTVDLNGDIQSQLQAVANRTKVFLSYHHGDEELKERLFQKLIGADFLVWENSRMAWVGFEWNAVIAENLRLACEEGFVLALVTERYLRSQDCRHELKYSMAHSGQIVPVIVGDCLARSLDPLALELSLFNGLRIGSDPSEEELDRTVRHLLSFFD